MTRLAILILVSGAMLAIACGGPTTPDAFPVVQEVQRVGSPEPEPPEKPLFVWGETRFRHTRQIQNLVFRPDGKAIATSAYDYSPHITEWDMMGREVRRYSDPEHSVRHARVVGYTPDGRRLITNADYEWIVEFDTDTGKVVSRVGGRIQPFGLSAPVASPDGSVLAQIDGHVVRLLDAKTKAPIHPELDRYSSYPPYAIQFSSDGRWMLAVGYDGLWLWDLPAGKPPRAIDQGRRTISYHSTHISPDGRWIAGSNDHSIAVFAADTGEIAFRQPPRPVGSSRRTQVIGFDPSGRLWATDSWAGNITCHEVPSGKVLQTIKGFDQSTHTILSRDGRKLAVGGWKAFAVRDTVPAAEWHVVEQYPGRQSGGCGLDMPPCPSFAFTADSGRLITDRGEFDLRNMRWHPAEVRTQPKEAQPNEEEYVRSLGYSADGRRHAVAIRFKDQTTHVRVWETVSNTDVVRIEPAGEACGGAFTPDGKRLILANNDTTLGVWDYARLEARSLSPTAGDSWEMLAHPNAKVGLAAVSGLVADPNSAVELLKSRYRPIIDPKRVKDWIADLCDEDFATRETAENELAKLGSHAEGAIREATKSPSPETSRRAERLLRGIKPTSAVRAVRAVEVAERIDTAATRELLETWAKSSSDVLLQSEAKSALERMASTRP